MDFKVFQPKDINDFVKYVNGIIPDKLNNEDVIELAALKEEFVSLSSNLTPQIVHSLYFVRLIYNFCNRTPNINDNKSVFIDLIHYKLILQNKIEVNYRTYHVIDKKKLVIQYFEELLFLIQENVGDTKKLLLKVNNYVRAKGNKSSEYITYVLPTLKINDRIVDNLKYEFHTKDVPLKSTQINVSVSNMSNDNSIIVSDEFYKLYTDLCHYIRGLKPNILRSIIINKRLPDDIAPKILFMRNGKKSDIVRFGDFFGLSIAQLNKIFSENVDSNSRNKMAPYNGIYKDILSKYKDIIKKMV